MTEAKKAFEDADYQVETAGYSEQERADRVKDASENLAHCRKTLDEAQRREDEATLAHKRGMLAQLDAELAIAKRLKV